MIVAIANNKGGVAKTTLAVHFATWLTRQGHRVLLLDLDTQGSVARFLGLLPGDELAELFHAVLNLSPARRPPFRSFLTGVPDYPDLVVIRGWGRSADLEALLTTNTARAGGSRTVAGVAADVLRDALAPVVNLAEVVIDTGPYAGTLQQAALLVADHVFVPGVPEPATDAGVLDIARRLREVHRGITGLIPTKIVSSHIHEATIASWQRALPNIVYYDPPHRLHGLPRRVIWGEIVGYGRPIWNITPKEWSVRRAVKEAATEMETVVRRMAYDAEIGSH